MKARGIVGGAVLLALLSFSALEPGIDELAAAPPGYVKQFEDHFDGPELNPDYWTFGLRDPDTGDPIPGAQGDHLLNSSYDGYATEEDTYIEDGALVLRNQKRPYVGTSPAGNYAYTTGWVMSMHKVFFNKGYIEFRAKFPRGDKVWPALWLIPERLVWPPEWDLWEYFGFRADVGYDIMGTHLATGTCCQNVIWHDNWLRDYDATYGNEEWHVYGFEWTDEGAKWWIDGELVHSLDAAGVSMYPDEDFYIVMNNGTRTDSPDTNTEWPNHLIVDYVEIYQASDDTTPPTTTAALDPPNPGPGGTYEVPVTVALTATDDEGGSGVDSTEYRVNGGDFQDYENPFTLTANGAYTIEFRSTDVAGNVEELRSVAFEIADPVEPPPVGEPRLSARAQPKRVKVPPRKQVAKLRFRAGNVGDAPTGALGLCVKAPKKRLAVRGKRCVARPSLEPGQAAQRPVKLRVKPKARGKTTKVTLIARGPEVGARRATARVNAKR